MAADRTETVELLIEPVARAGSAGEEPLGDSPISTASNGYFGCRAAGEFLALGAKKQPMPDDLNLLATLSAPLELNEAVSI
jgi:hypothetical protein